MNVRSSDWWDEGKLRLEIAKILFDVITWNIDVNRNIVVHYIGCHHIGPAKSC
ncbi:MAG: hypothetical protein IPN19_01700 [Elusimicrobia bacterium]|nr:hypothetical protein [Elusimicrobiota bacterium]